MRAALFVLQRFIYYHPVQRTLNVDVFKMIITSEVELRKTKVFLDSSIPFTHRKQVRTTFACDLCTARRLMDFRMQRANIKVVRAGGIASTAVVIKVELNFRTHFFHRFSNFTQ